MANSWLHNVLLWLSLWMNAGAAFILQPQSSTVKTGTALCAKTTLSEETTWKMRLFLKGLPTKNGKKVDEIFNVNVMFVEEVGYEPPQGKLVQQELSNKSDEDESRTATSRLKIANSRWQLSEDPSERKDGLWVWGLFAEPLYPFLLLQFETDAIPLPGEGADSIKPLRLFVQMNHQRDKESGVVLKGGDLKVREVETVKADPFGAATVDIYDEVTVGTLKIEPI